MSFKSIFKIQISLIFLISPFLNGCLHDCGDYISRKLNENEIDFFPYDLNDTLTFTNLGDSSSYRYIMSEIIIVENDTIDYYEDYYCDDGGYFTIGSFVKISLATENFTIDNKSVNISLKLSTDANSPKSIFQILFRDGLYHEFVVHINASTYELTPTFQNKHDSITFYNELTIRNDLYKNVYKIEPGIVHSDSNLSSIKAIYLNEKFGILEIVSERYDFDLVLKR